MSKDWSRSMLSIGRWRGTSELPAECHGGEPFEAAPQRLGAGLAVALAGKEPTKSRRVAYRLAHREQLCGAQRLGFEMRCQYVHLAVAEQHRAWPIGLLAREFLHLLDASRDYDIERQTAHQPICGSQLSVLDSTTALEGAMKVLDPPAPLIPVDLLPGLLLRGHRQRGPQHPFNGLDAAGGILLTDVDHREPDAAQIAVALGRLQVHRIETHVELGRACGAVFVPRNLDHILCLHGHAEQMI